MKPTIKYVCSLIAGAAISLALLLVAADLTAPAAATDQPPPDPFAWVVAPEPVAWAAEPGRFDDGIVVAGGAHLNPPSPAVRQGTVPVRYVTVCRLRRSDGWWTRGPLRRLVSRPFRPRERVRVRCR